VSVEVVRDFGGECGIILDHDGLRSAGFTWLNIATEGPLVNRERG
jgi:hypothetical protein